MGIKGIYAEIGHGQRVALTKLAIDSFEGTGRPLRIAVDISIWQFQVQSGKGGSNPALRTFYYRLLRLLSTSVQPLFVFDGSQKPPFKRNKRTGAGGPSLTDFYTKQLLKFFGFPFHVAPGEAEAECALLQREGIVDAVLSEDVDTLMFGCGRTLRDWSSEGSRGNHGPSHVTVYDAKVTKEGKSGLDREGMILVALMSGGDYITEGIPGCGIKVACEAARAGFGKSLCMLSRTDGIGISKWRENLVHELQTNESKHFRVKHKALQIPESFPNREVLGYYTHPVVSSGTKLKKLKEEIEWERDIDIAGLRNFVAEAFDWTHVSGARKFTRGLAPALLVAKLRARANRRASGFDDIVYTAMNEMELVREICGRRQHFSTDGIPELRLVYHPAHIIGLDLDAEVDDSEDYGRDGLAPLGSNEIPLEYCFADESDYSSRTKSRNSTKIKGANYDPMQFQKIWVPETIAKVGIPLLVEDYEEALRKPQKTSKSKVTAKKTVASGGMPKGALDRYVTIVKPVLEARNPPSPKKLHSVLQELPPANLAPVLNSPSPSCTPCTPRGTPVRSVPINETISKRRARPAITTEKSIPRPGAQMTRKKSRNPWDITQSSSPTSRTSIIHISKPGLATASGCSYYESKKPFKEAPYIGQDFNERPPSPPSPPSPLGKHSRPVSSSSTSETSVNSSRASQNVSATKKRHPIPSARSRVPEPSTKHAKMATQEVVEIASSPILPPNLPLSLESRADSSVNKAVQELGKIPAKVVGKGAGKKLIQLRESLEGSWKEVEQDSISDRLRGRAWRRSQVEELDMTAD